MDDHPGVTMSESWIQFVSISCAIFSAVLFISVPIALRHEEYLLIKLSFRSRYGKYYNAAFNALAGFLNLSLYKAPVITRSEWYLFFGYLCCLAFFYSLARRLLRRIQGQKDSRVEK